MTIVYQPEEALQLSNTGASVKADCVQENSTLSGGPLGQKVYRLAQFHLHWGAKDDRGAEHTVDGKVYAAELHLVHWNSSDYKSFQEAASQKDGLAVLCMFIEVGDAHKGFEMVSSQLSKATCKGDCCELDVTFDPTCLLPENTQRFWTYHGSLTTPPCYESVQFILFEEVIQFSSEQMTALRSLHFGDNTSSCMVDNFRPTCKLGERTVLASFAQ
ncbi:carbonic anhydrase 2-like isoform X2 [Babylonia areolata]